MKRLFGTDGIRGRSGDFPLDAATIRVVGASLARQLSETLGRAPRLVTGRDTRESGEWIETAFHAGANGSGAICESAGVITTPGVAYLTNAFEFDAGVVISASHNPFEDNGIKIFSPSGRKIGEDVERAIEKDIHDGLKADGNSDAVNAIRAEEFRSSYLRYLSNLAGGTELTETKIVIDCANGAASGLAPELFTSLGADVVTISNSPDGRNINDNCGSLHLQHLKHAVVEEKADFGVAFDGDADRALFVDENGEVVDGDAVLWIMARYLKDRGKLSNSTVVATVMSNIGLELALKSKHIKLLRTDVGDKYVLEKLIETRSEIGGEQSGHIIFPQISLVGDGMMTALFLLKTLSESNVRLTGAVAGFVRYPQILVNVKVKEKRSFDEVPQIADAARQLEHELDGEGRLLLRYSGTENLARVMIEGKDQGQIEIQANRLASVIQSALG